MAYGPNRPQIMIEGPIKRIDECDELIEANVNDLCEILVKTTRKVIIHYEKRRKSPCDFRGSILFNIRDLKWKIGNIDSYLIMARQDDSSFEPSSYSQTFHFPLGGDRFVEIQMDFKVRDNNAFRKPNELAEMIAADIIKKMVSFLVAEDSQYDWRDSTEALYDTAVDIIKANPEVKVDTNAFVELGKKYGYEDTVFKLFFDNAYYSVLREKKRESENN